MSELRRVTVRVPAERWDRLKAATGLTNSALMTLALETLVGEAALRQGQAPVPPKDPAA